MLKLFYNKTNKHENFLEQLVWHNQQQIKTLAMKEIVASLYESKNFTNNLIEVTVTKSTRDYLELKLFGIMDQINNERGTIPNPRHWCRIIDLANVMDKPELIPALAMFIRK